MVQTALFWIDTGLRRLLRRPRQRPGWQ